MVISVRLGHLVGSSEYTPMSITCLDLGCEELLCTAWERALYHSHSLQEFLDTVTLRSLLNHLWY